MTQTLSKEKKPIPIKIKLLIFLAIFVVVTIAVLWIFQSILLDQVYGFVRTNNLKGSTREIESALGDDIDTTLVYIAQQHGVCSIVYKVQNGYFEEIASAHILDNCYLHSIASDSDSFIKRMYVGAKEGDKYYIEQVSFNFKFGFGGPRTVRNDNMYVLCSRVVEADGFDYLIITNCEMIPVNSTVLTLNYQLIIITLILLVVAIIVGFLVSNIITKPIVKMNEEAKKLAKGDYNVDFKSKSFKETEELGKTLNYAAQELSKLDVMQKELIANISHDLRTPLTMISGYSEVMRDIPGENTPENMQVIIDETKRLSSLVDDMLDLSKLNEAETKLNLETFDFTKTVSEVLERYSALKSRDGYIITFEYEEPVCVNADRTRILQVVYNLVNNAINYTGEDKKVTIRQITNNGKVRLEIIDTGEGVPEDELSKIWQKYYRFKEFHKRPVVGTGLGLTIAKNCLDLHKATYGVISTIGSGSTFWFELDIVS